MNNGSEGRQKLSQRAFYGEYHGHRVIDLQVLLAHIKDRKSENSSVVIYLAGDSSLDNKFWFPDTAPAVNGYEDILEPAVSKKDIAYWMNYLIDKRNLRGKFTVINAAVEESTIGSRACFRLLPQDVFIRDNITAEDVLVLSIGGNDIALRPSCCTALSTVSLICCNSTSSLHNNSCGTALPVDDYCCGCCCGAASSCCACPPGMGYFIHLFSTRIQSLVTRMTSKVRPRVVLVCMIYFLDEKPGNSWAEAVLNLLGYNSNPAKLQEMIRQVFRLATQHISIAGTTVVAVPLFESLDGKNSADYCQRVEPSASGGEKMGAQLLHAVINTVGGTTSSSGDSSSSSSSSSSYCQSGSDRGNNSAVASTLQPLIERD